MSDSPKYSTPSLQAQQEQRLRAERERSAREAAAKRATEEERRRQERIAEERRRVEQLTREKKSAKDAVGSVKDLIEGLRADDVVVRWCGTEANEFLTGIEQAAGLIDAGKFLEATSKAKSIRQEAEACIDRSDQLQLNEDRRQYIIRGMLAVLDEMGFVVSAGSPSVSDPTVPTSDVLIQARRLGGGALALSVPQQGEILYEVDGYARRLESGRDGGTYKTCDEAERDISLVHDMLEKEFGIHMSELMWDGKPVDRTNEQECLPMQRPERIERS